MFNVTYNFELQNAILFIINVIFYQIRMLLSYNDQTTDVTFVGQKGDIQ